MAPKARSGERLYDSSSSSVKLGSSVKYRTETTILRGSPHWIRTSFAEVVCQERSGSCSQCSHAELATHLAGVDGDLVKSRHATVIPQTVPVGFFPTLNDLQCHPDTSAIFFQLSESLIFALVYNNLATNPMPLGPPSSA